MQKKSVVSFDDNFEDRASKSVGKNFHKFVENTQRASASSSPLLFAGAGTLPIEYSSKPPLSFVVQKQKLGSKGWFESYKTFSDRYRVLYGLETSAEGAASSQFPVIHRSGDGEVEIADNDEVDDHGYAGAAFLLPQIGFA